MVDTGPPDVLLCEQLVYAIVGQRLRRRRLRGGFLRLPVDRSPDEAKTKRRTPAALTASTTLSVPIAFTLRSCAGSRMDRATLTCAARWNTTDGRQRAIGWRNSPRVMSRRSRRVSQAAANLARQVVDDQDFIAPFFQCSDEVVTMNPAPPMTISRSDAITRTSGDAGPVTDIQQRIVCRRTCDAILRLAPRASEDDRRRARHDRQIKPDRPCVDVPDIE